MALFHIATRQIFPVIPKRLLIIKSAGLRTSTNNNNKTEVDEIKNKIPKRLTPFSLYFKENYPVVKTTNVGKTHADLVRLLASDFKSLKPEAKEKYVKTALKSAADSKNAKNKLSESERKKLLIDLRMRREKSRAIKIARKLNKIKHDHNYPASLNKNAYMIFSQEKMDTLKDLKSVKERSRKGGELWRQLNETDKNKYREKATEAMRLYKSAVNEWEEKMKKKQNADVLQSLRSLQAEHRAAVRRVNKIARGDDLVKPKKKVAKKRRVIGLKAAKPRVKRLSTSVRKPKRKVATKKAKVAKPKAKKAAAATRNRKSSAGVKAKRVRAATTAKKSAAKKTSRSKKKTESSDSD